MKMYEGHCTPRAPATSHGSSRNRAKTVRQENAVNHYPSDYRCDVRDSNTNFGCQSDLRRHGVSVHCPKQQCPPDHHGYETGTGDGMKVQNLNGMPDAKFQNSKVLTGSQYDVYNTVGQDIFRPTDRVDIDNLSDVDRSYTYNNSSSSQIQSSYNTFCSSYVSSDDLAYHDISIVPYASTSIYLNGIGEWVEDSSSGSTWTAWQNPEVLLEHASRFNIASVKRKPHVEEAMDCFQSSFYGVGGATPGYHVVEH